MKDAYSNRIVGYLVGARLTSAFAVTALANAITFRGPVDAVHSDRGSEFRSHVYVRALTDARLRGSIVRVGACQYKAAMGVILQPAARECPRPAAAVAVVELP